jgi:hypothetical protein
VLANALVCVALVAFAANTILSAGLLSVRTSIHRLAQNYVNQDYQRAIDSLQTGVAAYAQSGMHAGPLPTFTPLPALCAGVPTPCAFTSTANIALLRSDFEAAPAPCDSASACASNEKTNLYVSERRMTAQVSVTVHAADGSILAARDDDVTLRVMSTPPYVAIVGVRDHWVDAIASGDPASEDAGRPPATSNPCVIGSPGNSDDTVVRVAYENAQTGACTDGSAWRTTSY